MKISRVYLVGDLGAEAIEELRPLEGKPVVVLEVTPEVARLFGRYLLERLEVAEVAEVGGLMLRRPNWISDGVPEAITKQPTRPIEASDDPDNDDPR